jgi:hypothetical protein
MFGTFEDPKANSGQTVETHISRMGVEIEEEEEHASNPRQNDGASIYRGEPDGQCVYWQKQDPSTVG